MNIQLTAAQITAYLRTLIAWVGLILSTTDAIPQLHAIRPTMLACSSLLLTVEHGVGKLSDAQKAPQP